MRRRLYCVVVIGSRVSMLCAISFLAILCCGATALAGAPSCFGNDAVNDSPENFPPAYLSKSGADDVKRHVAKVAGKGTWNGTTYVMPCGVQGPEIEMSAASVETGGAGAQTDAWNKQFFVDLAKRTGHTKQEADVLGGKYAKLAGAFYRHVPDGNGGTVTEETLILKRHQKKVGIAETEASAEGVSEDLEKRAKALEAKLMAAQKRGDAAEMMRLAAEAQSLSTGANEKATKVMRKTDQQTWQLLESAYSELAEAAYRTRIKIHPCPCIRCGF